MAMREKEKFLTYDESHFKLRIQSETLVSIKVKFNPD